jgi:hypothetical protein
MAQRLTIGWTGSKEVVQRTAVTDTRGLSGHAV